MKLVLSLIDWEYPEDGKADEPSVWDLDNANSIMGLVLEFGNGVIIEMRADGDCEDALEALRGLAIGTGRCTLAETITPEIKKAWLYKEGYDCYIQPTTPPAYIFISPHPNPALFT